MYEESAIKEVNPFMDVEVPSAIEQQIEQLFQMGSKQVTNVDNLSVGAGSNSLLVDQSGLSIGGQNFAAAPFSVDMNGNVTASTLSVNGSQIANGSITGSKIASNTITASNIAANTITASQIASNTITATQINSGYVYAGNISASQINAGTMSANFISGGTIDATTINVTNLNASHINSGTLSSSQLPGLVATTNGYFSSGVRIGGAGASVSGLDMQTDIGMNNHNINGLNQVFVATVSGGAINGTSLSISGSKSAIIKTSKGWRKVYSSEAPEVWLFDFCNTPFLKDLDPMFKEMTAGKAFYIPVFKEGGVKQVAWQVWRHRNGFSKKRFELASKKEKTHYNNK